LTAYRAARAVAITSIFVSAALALAKIIIGLKANSTSVVSDGLESATDVLTSGIVLFGLVVAAKPPDEEHPYGHGRVETLMGLVVGLILAVTGSLICFRSLQRIFEIQTTPSAFAVWPLIASIVVKGVLALVKWRYSRRSHSSGLSADAWNDAMDTLSGCTALAALGLTLFDPRRFIAADHLGGAAVGLIVIFLGFHVMRDTTLQLMDTMPSPDAMREIREVALSVPGALGIEKCFARKTGLQYHVDLHLEVDPAMSVFVSHEIATQVRDRIREKLDWVANVLVHVEPHLFASVSGSSHGKS
jgi:cation diffusion facilitator family transporter